MNAGCFTIQILGDCRVRLDATCVSLPVDRYEWVLDQDDKWQRVNIPNGSATFVYDWGGDCDDDDENIVFRLTVHRGASNDSSTKSAVVPGDDLRIAPGARSVPFSFQTQLAVPPVDGSAHGTLSLNGSPLQPIDSASPARRDGTGHDGRNQLDAVVTDIPRGGYWRFDFSQASHFTTGSLRVLEGNLVSSGGSILVFQLSGASGERISFTFELTR